MFGFLIVAGLVLIVGILILMFRVEVLVGVARKKDDTSIGATNNVNAALFIVFTIVGLVSLIWYSWAEFDRYRIMTFWRCLDIRFTP